MFQGYVGKFFELCILYQCNNINDQVPVRENSPDIALFHVVYAQLNWLSV